MNAVVDTWGRFVIHGAWQAAVVAVVALALVRLGRRWPAPIRYGLLLVALAKFALPPVLSSPTSLFSHWGPTAVTVEEPAIRVKGQVVEKASRKPIAGASIGLQYGNRGQQHEHVVSNDDGQFTAYVLPGEVRFSMVGTPLGFMETEDSRRKSDSARFFVSDEDKDFSLPTLEVERYEIISGRLLDVHDQPVANMRVTGPPRSRSFTDGTGAFQIAVPLGCDLTKLDVFVDSVGMPATRAEVVGTNPLVLRWEGR